MNLNEIDYRSIDEDELDKIIFKECGINDFFINQSTKAYEELKYMLTRTMLKNGISNILSENDANQVIDSIKENWIIDENSVTSDITDLQETNSELYARNVKKYMATQVKKLDDNTMQQSYLWHTTESDFSEEAQGLGFEDMPQILENDNRICESISSTVYSLNPNGEDILNSRTIKQKISTLNKKDALNLSAKSVQEVINLPDEYFPYINKISYTPNLNLSSLVPNNIEKIEKRKYTDEEFSKMTQNVISKTEMGNREQIMEQALRELGVSEKLLDISQKQVLYDIVEESIRNNGEISDLTNQTQIEQLLRQLNKDLIIKKDYLARGMKPDQELIDKTSQKYETNPNEIIRNDIIEFYVDDDGLYNINQIASMYLGKIHSNVQTSIREKKYAKNNSEMEPLVVRDKTIKGTTTLEEYNQSKLRDMDIDTGIAIRNKPNSMWQTITTSVMRPDIVISRIIQSGKNNVRENQINSRNENTIQPSIVISGNNTELQQGPGYSNFESEVTEQEIQEAERLIATRSDALSSGAVSQVAENSEKVLDEVSEYIEGDADTRAAKTANEREKTEQQNQNRQEQDNITK